MTKTHETNATVRRAMLGHLVKVATLYQRDETRYQAYRGYTEHRGYETADEIRTILAVLDTTTRD